MILPVLTNQPNHYSTPPARDCYTSVATFNCCRNARNDLPPDPVARRAEGIALGIVLLFLAFLVNALLQYAQGKGSINP